MGELLKENYDGSPDFRTPPNADLLVQGLTDDALFTETSAVLAFNCLNQDRSDEHKFLVAYDDHACEPVRRMIRLLDIAHQPPEFVEKLSELELTILNEFATRFSARNSVLGDQK